MRTRHESRTQAAPEWIDVAVVAERRGAQANRADRAGLSRQGVRHGAEHRCCGRPKKPWPHRGLGAGSVARRNALGDLGAGAVPTVHPVAQPGRRDREGHADAAGAGRSHLDFKVVLETHSQALVDDLTRTATLVTDDGRSLKPTAWSGSGPGGHHREGVLHFAMPEPQPGAFELRISRAGEWKVRVFRWTR